MKLKELADKLNELKDSYRGSFDKLFVEIGQLSAGPLVDDVVFYSKTYDIFKIRPYRQTYYESDYDIEPKQCKDKFYNINGEKIGSSLLGSRLHIYVKKFIIKYNIKKDFNIVKMLFVSMCHDSSNCAKQKLKNMSSR